MKKIFFKKEGFTIVDDEDFERLSKYTWFVNDGYVKRSVYIGMDEKGRSKTKTILLHREIMNVRSSSVCVDHINMDKLDNRKENLRIANKSENGCNRGKNKNNTTGYKGVYFIKRKDYKTKKYEAYIVKNRKKIVIGRYKTAEEASFERNKFAKQIHGEFAR